MTLFDLVESVFAAGVLFEVGRESQREGPAGQYTRLKAERQKPSRPSQETPRIR